MCVFVLISFVARETKTLKNVRKELKRRIIILIFRRSRTAVAAGQLVLRYEYHYRPTIIISCRRISVVKPLMRCPPVNSEKLKYWPFIGGELLENVNSFGKSTAGPRPRITFYLIAFSLTAGLFFFFFFYAQCPVARAYFTLNIFFFAVGRTKRGPHIINSVKKFVHGRTETIFLLVKSFRFSVQSDIPFVNGAQKCWKRTSIVVVRRQSAVPNADFGRRVDIENDHRAAFAEEYPDRWVTWCWGNGNDTTVARRFSPFVSKKSKYSVFRPLADNGRFISREEHLCPNRIPRQWLSSAELTVCVFNVR